MLAIAPDLVDLAAAEAVDPPDDALPLTDYDAYGDNRVGWALSPGRMDALTHTGSLGDPTAATKAHGRALVEAAVENIVQLVDGLSDTRA